MKRRNFILFALLTGIFTACGIYKFNDTSIAPDVHTISVYTIENRAMKVNPQLSNTLTLALQDQYRKLTKLEMLECHETQVVWMREHDGIDFPDMVRTCCRYRGFQCGADYAEGFRQCQVYLKGTTKRLLP